MSDEMIMTECMKCGDQMTIIPVFGCTKGICNKCLDAERAAQSRGHVATSTRIKWEKLTENFKALTHTDWYKLPCPDMSSKAMEWEYGAKGLNLWGPPRTGKTRTMLEILRREYENGKTMRIFGPADFALTMSALGFNRSEWLKKLRHCDVLAFDDIGKLRLTPIQEGEFFGLVDLFTASGKPIIVTHNFKGDELARKFKETGEALVSRIRDFCKSLHFVPTIKRQEE